MYLSICQTSASVTSWWKTQFKCELIVPLVIYLKGNGQSSLCGIVYFNLLGCKPALLVNSRYISQLPGWMNKRCTVQLWQTPLRFVFSCCYSYGPSGLNSICAMRKLQNKLCIFMLMKMLKIDGDSFLKVCGRGRQNMPPFQPNSWKVIVIKQMFYA